MRIRPRGGWGLDAGGIAHERAQGEAQDGCVEEEVGFREGGGDLEDGYAAGVGEGGAGGGGERDGGEPAHFRGAHLERAEAGGESCGEGAVRVGVEEGVVEGGVVVVMEEEG